MTHRPSFRAFVALWICAAAATTGAGFATSPKFFADDPVWDQPDTQDASGMTSQEVDLTVDLTYNLLTGRTRPGDRAGNVNTIDEVPDSSWFTNRARRAPLTPERVAQGPDTSPGPAAGPWTITASKSDGITPGFTVTDADNQRWFIKFDPRGYRGMSTGTEVTVTKLMWALGYNVPENHLAGLQRSNLVIGDGARITLAGGRRRPMRDTDIDAMLTGVDRDADGSFRVVASKALEGTPIGRIRFAGTRGDDPNDLVPHEDRRELRAYGVFAAWLNHVDAKAINSLDTLVTANGRAFVRHHLIDFGSALGSGGVAPADYWGGAQYLVEARDTLKRAATLGLAVPPWRSAPFYEAPAIGRMPSAHDRFDPDAWKPRVPNRAFLRARADDRFWAARQLAKLTRPMLQAAVAAGQFNDPPSEAFLVEALAARRDVIMRRYLTAINPIVDPVLSDERLTFDNAAMEIDHAQAPQRYVATWFVFDNATHEATPLAETAGATPPLAAPPALPRATGAYVKVRVHSTGTPHSSWQVPVDLYFRRLEGDWRLVGLERQPAPE